MHLEGQDVLAAVPSDSPISGALPVSPPFLLQTGFFDPL